MEDRSEMTQLKTKRTYAPRERSDGHRILVERLWPRGQTHEDVAAEVWLKEVAPSTELRRWFNHDPERWDEFRERYRRELEAEPQAWRPLLERLRQHDTVTLLYSARDEHHNSALVLRAFLLEQLADEETAGAPA